MTCLPKSTQIVDKLSPQEHVRVIKLIDVKKTDQQRTIMQKKKTLLNAKIYRKKFIPHLL